MTLYSDFALVYDQFMADAPYQDWLNWMTQAEQDAVIPPLATLSVADVGCGTGILTVDLATRCRAIVGVDLSEGMLAEAAARALAERAHVQWLCQDVRDLRLPFVADLVLSTCDCFNYLLTEEDWQSAFRKVANQLHDGGWFCFDVLGPGRIESLLNGLWHDIADDAVVLFETQVSEHGRIRYDVHGFQSVPGTGLYSRIEECHEQQYVRPEVIAECLQLTGFAVHACIGDFGRSTVDVADRIAFMARKE